MWGIDSDFYTRFLIGPRDDGEDTIYDVMTYAGDDWIKAQEQVDGGIDGAICAMLARGIYKSFF